MAHFNWGGFYYTSFVIDPKEDLIAIFMGQLNPTGGLNLSSKAISLVTRRSKIEGEVRLFLEFVHF